MPWAALADANDGVRLLLTDDPAEAATLADRFEVLNRERQQMDQRILEEVLAEIEAHHADPTVHTAPCAGGRPWHPGVMRFDLREHFLEDARRSKRITVVPALVLAGDPLASRRGRDRRITRRRTCFGRPTFLIGLDGDMGKGSGRSIDRFDLHAALTECGDLLERYGGHKMAAGLTIRRDRLEAFRERFNAVARGQLTLDDLGPTQRVDLELSLADVTDELERWSRHLEPCGMGNPGPVLGVRGVHLLRTRTVGSNHLKGELSANGRTLDAIAFGWADRVTWLGDAPVDVAFRLERNEWNGRSALRARIVSMAPALAA